MGLSAVSAAALHRFNEPCRPSFFYPPSLVCVVNQRFEPVYWLSGQAAQILVDLQHGQLSNSHSRHFFSRSLALSLIIFPPVPSLLYSSLSFSGGFNVQLNAIKT